ncbi:hypothetical protein Tco_0015512 [Tanacetum coccineum]
MVLEKYSQASKNKKERYKSLALKAKTESSDKETYTSGSEDEEYVVTVRDFRRRGRFVRQPHNDKKVFQKVKEDKKGKGDRKCSDNEEEEELKKDEIYLIARESNKVHSYSRYYSSSSLDDETLQIEYNKLCKISLKIINKNKLLKNKTELLDNEILKVKDKIKRLEKEKDTLVSKLARFENSAQCLKEMLSHQKSSNDKRGLDLHNV